MFSNYLKVAFRSLARYKGHSLINIAGLAVGMACCMLILLWVQHELSYDRFNAKADNLYRVVQENSSVTSPPIVPAVKAEIPEIANAARFRTLSQGLLKSDDQSFRGNKLGLVDPEFLDMFSVQFVNGDPTTALDDPHSIILTEKTAAMIFGDEDPLGQTINFDNITDFRVTGVVRDWPDNSHMSFDVLMRFDFLFELWVDPDAWEDFSHHSYVLLPENADLSLANQKINDLYDRHSPGNTRTLHLQPVTDIHLYQINGAPGAVVLVYLFSAVALVVLAIACINFINLTTARGARRAREIGIRKVVGAAKHNLIRQFLGESILIALVAFIFAAGMVELTLPMFNELVGKNLDFDLLSNLSLTLEALGIVLVTGSLAGIFPALYLSSYKPVSVLKGDTAVGRGGRSPLRKALVITQFALSISLIIGSIVIYRQLDFIGNADLGYHRDNIICLRTNTDEIMQVAPAFQEISQYSGIAAGTICGNLPGNRESSTDKVSWEGKDSNSRVVFEVLYAGYGFLETFGIDLIEGRYYSPEFPSDLQDAFVVNETAVRVIGITEGSALGRQFKLYDKVGTIVGVTKDFHNETLHEKIRPLVFSFSPYANDNLVFRLNPENVSATIAWMDNIWKLHAPDYPFEFTFFDEFLNELYQTEQRVGKIINYFTALAIFISCLGLLGLASFMAEQRTREIGIRKVLGASVGRVIRLLTAEFVVLVVIANVLAWPIAWYASDKWLATFAYRTDMGWFAFPLAALSALAVALATVSFRAFQAARANPIEAIKYE